MYSWMDGLMTKKLNNFIRSVIIKRILNYTGSANPPKQSNIHYT